MPKRALLGELAACGFFVLLAVFEGWPYLDAISAADKIPADHVILNFLKVVMVVGPGVALPGIILFKSRKGNNPKELPPPTEIPEFGFGFAFIKPNWVKLFDEAIKQRAMNLVPFEESMTPTSIRVVGRIEGTSPPMKIRGSKFVFEGAGKEFTLEIGGSAPRKADEGSARAPKESTTPPTPLKELTP